MSPRVTSDLLLVGSIPAASTEDALRAAAANFAGPGLVFALPDGETGPRSSWVGYERERLVRPNPDIETVKETDSPTGRPRHMYEAPVFRVRPGAAAVHGAPGRAWTTRSPPTRSSGSCARRASSLPACDSRSGCRFRSAR
jgi:hypothetical protein